MKKSFTMQGRHTVLPIVGDCVASICISAARFPEIIFSDTQGLESEIQLADSFLMGRGANMVQISPMSAAPAEMLPLLDCIGSTVTSATAFEEGRLELTFSNALTLVIASTTGYEAWHFEFPRPDRTTRGHASNHLSLHGAFGHLV